MHDLGQARERATAAAQQAEKLAGELRERDAAMQQLQAQVSTLTAAAEARQRALDEEAEKFQRERAKRQHLEEEHKVPFVASLLSGCWHWICLNGHGPKLDHVSKRGRFWHAC